MCGARVSGINDISLTGLQRMVVYPIVVRHMMSRIMTDPVERRFGPLLFLPGPNRGKYPFCHSVYVEGERRVLLDPASDRVRLEALRDGPGVDEVWLSHYHEDHLTNLDLFDDRPFRISTTDAAALADLDSFNDAYGITEPTLRREWSVILETMFNFRPRRCAHPFEDGEIVDLGGVTAEIIATPGHTAGHCAFFFREPAVLFLGDYDLTPFGPWYGDASSDIEATVASVRRLQGVEARVWIGAHEHGVFDTDPGPAWDDYLAVIDQREQQLLALLQEPRTLDGIVQAHIVYGKPREPRSFYDWAEAATMKKHLTRLEATGAVRREEERWVRV